MQYSIVKKRTSYLYFTTDDDRWMKKFCKLNVYDLYCQKFNLLCFFQDF